MLGILNPVISWSGIGNDHVNELHVRRSYKVVKVKFTIFFSHFRIIIHFGPFVFDA